MKEPFLQFFFSFPKINVGKIIMLEVLNTAQKYLVSLKGELA